MELGANLAALNVLHVDAEALWRNADPAFAVFLRALLARTLSILKEAHGR